MDERDDFDVFADSEHMFFGLTDPMGFLRQEIERALRSQVPSTEVVRIRAHGEPRFLTLGRRLEGEDASRMVVTHFGCCVRVDVSAAFEGGREVLPGTLTVLFGRVDEPEARVQQTFVDLHGDAEGAYAEERFRERFLAFRAEVGPA
ncbi:MAG: hypothetical protein R3F59_33970 [Myxococcota bacterium]